MNPSDIARIITDDIDWNLSEDEYSDDSDDGEIDDSRRFDELAIAEVSFCYFIVLAGIRNGPYKRLLVEKDRIKRTHIDSLIDCYNPFIKPYLSKIIETKVFVSKGCNI